MAIWNCPENAGPIICRAAHRQGQDPEATCPTSPHPSPASPRPASFAPASSTNTTTSTTTPGLPGTPASVHFGNAKTIDQARQTTLTDAYHAHPERFGRRLAFTRDCL